MWDHHVTHVYVSYTPCERGITYNIENFLNFPRVLEKASSSAEAHTFIS